MRDQKGLTLIELLIAIAIIGILVTIAMPSYQIYNKQSALSACLAEAKAYSNEVFLALNDQDDSTNPSSPIISACQSITDASSWNIENQQRLIVAVTKSSSNVRIECDLLNGVPCRIIY